MHEMEPKPCLGQASRISGKQTKSWYCSIKGRQIALGKDRRSAHQKFQELVTDSRHVEVDANTLYELSQAYLDWCQIHRKPGTYESHLRHLRQFIESVGKRLRPSQLRRQHVTRWHEGMTCGSTSRNDAVSVVQRMLNWAVEQEYIERNPVKGTRKPKRRRREVFFSRDQKDAIRKHASQPFLDLLDFLFLTGCRPLEARTLEARHLHDDLVIFPADESKGENESRVIYLVPGAKAIVERLAGCYPEGALFRNSRGGPWTKNAIVLRLNRISKKVGFRVIAYGARHSWATQALM